MDLKFLSNEETYFYLYRKFLNDWILVLGDPDGINALEWSVYTPDTHANADFEGMFVGLKAVYLAKKTPRLRKALKLDSDPDAWKTLIVVQFDRKVSTTGFLAKTGHYKGDKERYFETFAKKILRAGGLL